MSGLTLTSYGAAGTVTGSRHLLESSGRRLLIDCGLFQGLKTLREKNWSPFPVDPSSIGAVVLTHAHLDHSGYLPRLVREGFKGKIICTPATADLCELLLVDSAKIQESDAAFANRHGFSRHAPALPLYTRNDVEHVLRKLTPVRFGKTTDLGHGAHLTFRRAGHILGAATVDIRWADRTVVFSGDLGRYDDPLTPDPEPVDAADFLVVESTYGDRLHAATDPGDALLEVIGRTAARGGTVIIPAFAVGRAQQLLYHLWRLKRDGLLPLIPVFLDSPMAIDASLLFENHPEDHRLPKGVYEQVCKVATYVRHVEQSIAVTASPVPKIIVSASGMATGGRVLHHIKALGPDPRNTILFAGFQAAGTRGARLVAGEREVKIHGQRIPIRAEVANLSMLSAHADAGELMRWMGGFRSPPSRTFVVHGEPPASTALARRIGENLGWHARTSVEGETYRLDRTPNPTGLAIASAAL